MSQLPVNFPLGMDDIRPEQGNCRDLQELKRYNEVRV